MPSLSRFMSRFLKSEDVKKPQKVVVERVEIQTVGMPGEEEEKVVLYFKGLAQGLIMNKTNLRWLKKFAGTDDSDKWIGQTFEIYRDDNVTFQGKTIEGIRLRKAGA